MSRISIERAFFLLILASYVLLAALFVIRTPKWQAPDEPAHFNYVRQLADSGCCPQIEQGDWDRPYLLELTGNRFAPDSLEHLEMIEYEDHQPPFYYLLASPLYQLTNGNLLAIRAFSAVLGGIVVILAYLIGKLIYPDRGWLGLSAMAFVAFLPQHLAIVTSVNNDAMAEVIIGIVLLLTILYLKGAGVRAWQLGLLVGVGLLTKTTTYFLAAVVPVAIFLRWWTTSNPREFSQLVRPIILFLLPAVILGGIWGMRNISVYGFPDILGLGAHDLVVADQPRAADKIAEIGFGAYLQRGLTTTFQSFWGQFGWMALPLDANLYRILAFFLLAALSGLVLNFFRPVKRLSNVDRNIWIILGLTIIFAVVAYIYYNTEFEQFQGRYMFPGLIPFALLIALGLDAWRRLILGRWEWSRWVTVLLIWIPFFGLNLYLIWRVIPPNLSPA